MGLTALILLCALQGCSPDEQLRAVQTVLVHYGCTKAAVTLFRPVLLRAVAALVEDALSGSSDAIALPSAQLAVVLVTILELAPHTEGRVLQKWGSHLAGSSHASAAGLLSPCGLPGCRVVLRYFQHAPPPFDYLQPEVEAAPLPAVQLVYATLRGLQLCPPLRQLWRWSAALSLMHHADADVRWCAVECTALVFQLGDAGKAQVAARVLSQGEGLGAALRWQNVRAEAALEVAAMYLGGEYSPAEEEEEEEEDGGMEVEQPAGQGAGQAAAPDASPRKRKFGSISSGPASSGQGGGGLAPAVGYVDVCGLELPRRHATPEGSQPPAQHLVHTATVDHNLECLALGLCLRSPLVLEGPPGSGKSTLIEHIADLTGNSAGDGVAGGSCLLVAWHRLLRAMSHR